MLRALGSLIEPRNIVLRAPVLVLLVLLGFTAAVYAPLTRVYFVADDFSNLDTIINRGAFYFIVDPFAGHMGFARNTEFYLLFAAFGAKAEPYGWLALVTHLLNVVLFFRIARNLTSSLSLAAFGTALWATSPMLAGVLGWFSAYGHSVSVTTALFLIDRTLHLPREMEKLPPRTIVIWAVLLIVGGTWFSTGVGALVAWPLVLALMIEPPLRRSDVIAAFVPVALVFFCIYYSWYWLFFSFEPMRMDEQIFREMQFKAFTPIFSMAAFLFAAGASGLLQSFWALAPGDPATNWWVVAAYVAILVAGFVSADARDRRRMVALFVLSAAVYGLTAVGRANVYLANGFPPSESARQVRYHYFATFPLALVLVLALKQGLRKVPSELPVAAVVGWAALTALFATTTEWQIRDNQSCRKYVDTTMREIDASIDSHPAGSDVYLANRDVPLFCTGVMGYDRVPGTAGIFAMFYPEDTVRGRHVRFIDEKGHFFKNPKNKRFSTLLVPPDENRSAL